MRCISPHRTTQYLMRDIELNHLFASFYLSFIIKLLISNFEVFPFFNYIPIKKINLLYRDLFDGPSLTFEIGIVFSTIC